jgi:Transposase/Transposase IS116/IS110/IS902 family
VGVETRRELTVLLVGIDWAERHHDVCLMAADGSVLARERIPDGVAGVARLHELIAGHASDPAEVVVGIETDRGLLVGALVAAGYRVVAVNPLAASRYRERHTISGAKSDRGDARMLADLVRTDRHHHRPAKGDSGLAEAVKVLARGHQQLVWARQRQANMLRSALRAFYPAALAAFGSDPGGRDAVAVLGLAPSPDRGRVLSHAELVRALRRAGRRRQVEARATAIRAALASQQLEAPAVVADAYSQVVVAAVAVIVSMSEQLAGLEAALTSAFTAHPDAAIVHSQPGLGVVLAARVLAEFGDDPNRYVSAKARKAYAGTAPITRASGLRQVVLARSVGNRRLSTACHLWAFAALTGSPGARRYYDAHRARGATHHQALRALANRLVGILHGCLRHRAPYDEQLAWPTVTTAAAA